MTIQKALEIIKNEMPYESGVINEALNIVENAVKKQIPKKPYKTKEHKQSDWYCSICKCYLGDDMELKYACLQPKFCEHCGQRIDWSECNG